MALVGDVADTDERLLFEEIMEDKGVEAAAATCGALRLEKAAKRRVRVLKVALGIAAAIAFAFPAAWAKS